MARLVYLRPYRCRGCGAAFLAWNRPLLGTHTPRAWWVVLLVTALGATVFVAGAFALLRRAP